MAWIDDLRLFVEQLGKDRVELGQLRDQIDVPLQALVTAQQAVDESSTHSWLGYQATLYFGDFERAPRYDIEWGGHPAGWHVRQYADVLQEIERRAGASYQELLAAVADFRRRVDQRRNDMVVVLAPVADRVGFDEERTQANRIAETKWGPVASQLLAQWQPTSTMTRDSSAITSGFVAPAHLRIAASLQEFSRTLAQGQEMLASAETIARRVLSRLEGTPHATTSKAGPVGQHVFVVHGRDEASKQTVARYIEKLDLTPIILQEEAHEGMTLVEKLVAHGGRAGFCVVILSPDDIGALAADEPLYERRARQNVIFEMGYFIGAIGRQYVAALLAGGVEGPSDIDGVGYINMAGDWKLELARELKVAGFDVDLNKAI